MRRRVVAVAVTLCLLCGLASAAAPAPQQESAFGQPESVDPDRVLVRADVPADGDARLTVEYRVALDDENAAAAFEGLQSDVSENTSRFRDRFADRLQRTARTAENATGREMAIENVTVTATQRFDGQYGVLRYSADWTGFAAVEGDRVRIGDALAGYYLDENSSLQIEVPEGYRVASVAPEADDRRDGVVSWRGPLSFAADRPVVVASSASGSMLPIPGWLLAGGALVVAGAVTFGLYRRRTVGSNDGGAATTADTTAVTDQSPDRSADGTANEPSTSGRVDPPDDTGGADPTGEVDPMAGIDPELLSNEELVEQTLRAHGGRMKQQALIDELDWSETKTSHVVSDMREADRLDSFRVGRENVLILPDADAGEFER